MTILVALCVLLHTVMHLPGSPTHTLTKCNNTSNEYSVVTMVSSTPTTSQQLNVISEILPNFLSGFLPELQDRVHKRKPIHRRSPFTISNVPDHVIKKSAEGH